MIVGNYALLEATDIDPGTLFTLQSAVLSNFKEAPYLVTFWYHIFGSDVSELKVYEWDGVKRSDPVFTSDPAMATSE